MKPDELRRQAANGIFDRPTAGWCDGYVQANLVVLPQCYAEDFEHFCRKNPEPCPLLERVGPGEHISRRLAPGADLLNTLPRYLIWRDGAVAEEVKQIDNYYQPDLVFFLLGCSFSFEEALIKAGIRLRHVEQGRNVSMYNTTLALNSIGPFHGNMVVSMRPIAQRDVARACAITAHFPDVHGGPVHVGYPERIGINDIGKVDYGDAVEVGENEIPVFWACGVTPQNVLTHAGLPFAITHAPGYMFVGDMRNEEFSRCPA